MKLPLLALGLLFACPLIALESPADFAAGKKAFDKGDDATAATEWKAAADDGDAAAQYWLGLLYQNGRGVDKDEVLGRRLQLLSAERGYEVAQNGLGWPIRAENRPYLTCSPSPLPEPRSAGDETPVQVDSMKGFRFEVTFHNARPPIERLIISASNMFEKPKAPNVRIAVYQLENGVRKEAPNEIISWGGGGDGGAGISDAVLLLGLRIPVEEWERRVYIGQYLALLSRTPNQTPEKVQQLRQLMLHPDRPNEPSYMDPTMPNRLGIYEIVCRYQSQNPGFWQDSLEAPPLRFEYIKTMNWIEIFDSKRQTPK